METKKPSPEEEERERTSVSAEPAPRDLPEYSSVSKTKPGAYPSEPKPRLRKEIVKR